jgi:hypothetical protein
MFRHVGIVEAIGGPTVKRYISELCGGKLKVPEGARTTCKHKTMQKLSCATLLIGLAVGGCAGMSRDYELAYVNPGKFQGYECEALIKKANETSKRESELVELMAKAQSGGAGSLVSTIAYGPTLNTVRGDLKLLRAAMAEKQCNPDAPPRR